MDHALPVRSELKGGTSHSKGYRITNRFPENIDICIEASEAMKVNSGSNHDKPAHRQSRKAFYDWLGATIGTNVVRREDIDEGMEKAARDGIIKPA